MSWVKILVSYIINDLEVQWPYALIRKIRGEEGRWFDSIPRSSILHFRFINIFR